jgi:hypothetical protein
MIRTEKCISYDLHGDVMCEYTVLGVLKFIFLIRCKSRLVRPLSMRFGGLLELR